jgi:hypothetical protein
LLRPLLPRLGRLRVLLLLRLLGALRLWLLLPRLFRPLLLRLGRLRALLLLRLLGALLLWLLLPRLFRPLLRLGRLRVLLLRLLGALLLLRLLPLFLSARLLRVRRDNRPEKQEQGGDARCSIELHSDGSPLRSPLSVHADDQRGLPVCQRLRFLRIGLGLLDRPVRVVGRRVERGQL